VLGVLPAEDTLENERLLRIVIRQVDNHIVAFHMIQKEPQLGIVLLGRADKFHIEARLVEHGQTGKRIPENDLFRIVLLRFFHAQLEIVRARRFIADKANAHLGMRDVDIRRVLGLVDFEAKRKRAASLGIQRKFLQSAHVDIDVKAEIDLDRVEAFDVGVFNGGARLDGAHVVFIVRTLKGDVVLGRMLARNGQRRFLESRGLERFHERLGFDAKDLLVDVVIGHGAAVDGLAGLDVALKLGLVGERKLGVVRFHTKARKLGRLGQSKTNFLDRVSNRLEEFAQQDAVGKRHAEKKLVQFDLFERPNVRLLGHIGRIELLVAHNNGLFLGLFGCGRLGIRVACDFGFLELGLGLGDGFRVVFGRDERVLLLSVLRSRHFRIRVGALGFLFDVFALGHFVEEAKFEFCKWILCARFFFQKYT
jgi:hypothetical protein